MIKIELEAAHLPVAAERLDVVPAASRLALSSAALDILEKTGRCWQASLPGGPRGAGWGQSGQSPERRALPVSLLLSD